MAGMESRARADDLIAALHPEERDALIPIDQSPAVIEELTRERLHASVVRRWARTGDQGVLLKSVAVRQRRLTTRRWLLVFFEEVEAARREQAARRRAKRRAAKCVEGSR